MDRVDLLIHIIKIFIVFNIVVLGVAYVTWAERRVAALIQDRLGPNRVGPGGLLQPIADGIKSLLKEDVIPLHVNRPMYLLAPVILLVPALVVYAVIPFGTSVHAFGRTVDLWLADINVGILFIFSISSVGVYGLILSAWSSNNKYALLGGLRSSAQLISYEIAMGLSVVGVLMLSGSLRLQAVVEGQAVWWNFILQPLGFFIFFVAALAETNRIPFDLPEAEPELVAGYHTEYSAMKLSMFFVAEYANVITSSALIVTLFFGGWSLPGVDYAAMPELQRAGLQIATYVGKILIFIFIFLWVRWTIPRFRYDQLMNLGWKVFLPLALLNIFVTGLVMLLTGRAG